MSFGARVWMCRVCPRSSTLEHPLFKEESVSGESGKETCWREEDPRKLDAALRDLPPAWDEAEGPHPRCSLASKSMVSARRTGENSFTTFPGIEDRMRRNLELLLAAVLLLAAFESLTPKAAHAVACLNAPDTPVEYGLATTCTAAQSQAYTAAYDFAVTYCSGYCTTPCLFTFYGATNCVEGPYQEQSYNGYATFGCLGHRC